jgi:hypothetical protein
LRDRSFDTLEKVPTLRFRNDRTDACVMGARLRSTGLAHFGESFIVVCKYLVITSNNAGMFFGDRRQVVLDYQTLGRILAKCD